MDRPLALAIVGNPDGRRVAMFREALAGAGHPPAAVLSYRDLLDGRGTLEQVVAAGTVLRIESPGQDFDVERAILAEGADVADGPGPSRIGRAEALRLPFDRGRIHYPRQWYLGFAATLRRIDRQRASCPPHVVMNAPEAIAVMFDKGRCHPLLVERGIACPRAIGPVGSYEELRERMDRSGVRRVFVKLAHGSSASGVVALECGPSRQQAFTTVELVRGGDGLRLYNSRRIRRYEHAGEIAELIDVLAREGVHVEQWVPKAGLAGRTFDLRVVVIAGRAEHVVVRLSRSPMTNLHLKNARGDVDALRARMSDASWDAALGTCERAAAAFPGSLYAGVDLAVAPGYRRHAVLEVNAFGDLLPGVTSRGRDTYAAEIAALAEADPRGVHGLSRDGSVAW